MKNYLEVDKPIQLLSNAPIDARATVKNLQEVENILNPCLGLIIYDQSTHNI